MVNYFVVVTCFPLCHPITVCMTRSLTRCMGEAGTSEQGGRGRFYCERKYKRRNECVTGEKETEGNSRIRKIKNPDIGK